MTISGPFGGIAAAKTCGKHWLYPLTLGLLPLSCYVATGAKWTDITNSSRFIRQPGALIPEVSSFLKIDTDERGSCRREKAAHCVDTDDVFSLVEQRNTVVEADTRARRIQVVAGHVEIVGDKSVAAPRKAHFDFTGARRHLANCTADRVSAFKSTTNAHTPTTAVYSRRSFPTHTSRDYSQLESTGDVERYRRWSWIGFGVSAATATFMVRLLVLQTFIAHLYLANPPLQYQTAAF